MKSVFTACQKALTVLMTLTALLVCGSAYAQNTIKGTVVDGAGQPVIGAAIMLPGTTTGTVSDFDGSFQINVAAGADLEVSCIGYTTQTVKAANGMKVVLAEDNLVLEEAVAIGYGSVKKSNLTAAVAKMDNSSIEDRPMARAEQALQGQLAGVTVRLTSSEPGADPEIRVRGTASISAGNNPLYVIDGVPQTSMRAINPNDIESIEVLKDAASSAIYGSRGSNGVVIVTTKQGKKGKPQVTFSASYGLATLEKKVDVLSSVEWMNHWMKFIDKNYLEMLASKGLTGSIMDDNATRLAKTGTTFANAYNKCITFDDAWMPHLSKEMQDSHTWNRNVEPASLLDWQDYLYKPAGTQNYNVSISGASDNTKYMFSLGYMDQNGLFPASNYKRINLRTNVQTKLNDYFTIGLNLAPSYIINIASGRGNGKDSQAHRALSSAPVSAAGVGYDVAMKDNVKYNWAGTSCYPIWYSKDIAPVNKRFGLQASTFLRFTPIKPLSIEATASANYSSSDTHTFSNNTLQNGNWTTKGEGESSTVSHSSDNYLSTLLQVVANYNQTFGKHDVSAMVGASSELSNIGYSISNGFKNLANDVIRGTFSGNNTSVTPTVSSASISESTKDKLLSLFGRAQYNYAGKYMLSASLRYDGYSRFGTDTKWGFFPSVSAGWMISQEPFWKNADLDWWNTFKFRASYGRTGNHGVGQSAAYSTLSQANYADELAYIIGSVGNYSLSWEKTHSTDVAMDFGFLNNRIQVSVDWYTKTTTDLLYNIPLPSTSGMSSTTGNSGSVYNTGIELEINTHNTTGEFKWDTSFNVSYNKNEVRQLGTENTTVYQSTNGAVNVLEVGKPMYYFYGLVCDGVWMNQKEIDDFKAKTGKTPKYQGADIKPGDLKHQDIDGDGNITDKDRQFIGKPTPDFTFGMTNRFTWRNFDASILFTAQTGGSIYGTLGRAIDRAQMGAITNAMGWWRGCWWSEEDPGNGMVPNPYSTVKPDADTRFIYKSDYFRIKNLTIGYKIPFKKVINSARVYLSIENLLLLDSYYHGYSPEAANVGTGMDYGGYPSARTFTAGININF